MRIRRVTYDLGNVIERQEYLDGRYEHRERREPKRRKPHRRKWSRSTNGPGKGKHVADSGCISK